MNRLKRAFIILAVLVIFVAAMPAPIVMAEEDAAGVADGSGTGNEETGSEEAGGEETAAHPNSAKIDKLNAGMFKKEIKFWSSIDKALFNFTFKILKFDEKLEDRLAKEDERQLKAMDKISLMDGPKRADAIDKELARITKFYASLTAKVIKFYDKMQIATPKSNNKLKTKYDKFYSGWDAKLAKLDGGKHNNYKNPLEAEGYYVRKYDESFGCNEWRGDPSNPSFPDFPSIFREEFADESAGLLDYIESLKLGAHDRVAE